MDLLRKDSSTFVHKHFHSNYPLKYFIFLNHLNFHVFSLKLLSYHWFPSIPYAAKILKTHKAKSTPAPREQPHAQKLRPIEVRKPRISVLRLVGVPDLGWNVESERGLSAIETIQTKKQYCHTQIASNFNTFIRYLSISYLLNYFLCALVGLLGRYYP
jgi:hypothetical protein